MANETKLWLVLNTVSNTVLNCGKKSRGVTTFKFHAIGVDAADAIARVQQGSGGGDLGD